MKWFAKLVRRIREPGVTRTEKKLAGWLFNNAWFAIRGKVDPERLTRLDNMAVNYLNLAWERKPPYYEGYTPNTDLLEAVIIVRGLLKNRSLLEVGKPLDGKDELAMDPETVMMIAKKFEIGLEQEHMELEEPGSVP